MTRETAASTGVRTEVVSHRAVLRWLCCFGVSAVSARVVYAVESAVRLVRRARSADGHSLSERLQSVAESVEERLGTSLVRLKVYCVVGHELDSDYAVCTCGTAGDDWASPFGRGNRVEDATPRVVGVPESELMGMTTSLRKLTLQVESQRGAGFASTEDTGSNTPVGSLLSREAPHPQQLCSICLGRLDDNGAAIVQEQADSSTDGATAASFAEEAVAPAGKPKKAEEVDGAKLLQVGAVERLRSARFTLPSHQCATWSKVAPPFERQIRFFFDGCLQWYGFGCLQLPCGHVYHWDCGRQWLQAHDSCPECRARVLPAAAGEGGGDADGLAASPPNTPPSSVQGAGQGASSAQAPGSHGP